MATIEPTAIQLGLPVNTMFGFTETDRLERELLMPGYRNAVVFIAWEHIALNKFAIKLISDLGGPATVVPKWTEPDYDRVYVIRIERSGGRTSVNFKQEREGLDGMSGDFPKPAA